MLTFTSINRGAKPSHASRKPFRGVDAAAHAAISVGFEACRIWKTFATPRFGTHVALGKANPATLFGPVIMDIGVFIPIGNNGWLISTTSPQYMPTFELNREIVQQAERYGLDFALSMIKLRGFGGVSEFWDHNLEFFTLMAGLAAVTQRIKLYASVAVLTIPPAIVARMAATIDSIAPGRFGINIVSGWAKAEYEQMDLWPGEAHFGRRYDYSTEYVRVMRELWEPDAPTSRAISSR